MEGQSAEHQDKIEEFKALRTELIFTMNARVWGNATYLVFAAGIFAGLFKEKLEIGCVLLIWGSIPFYLHNILRDIARLRIASYIRTQLEGGATHLHYESKLSKIRHPIFHWLHILSLVGIQYVISIAAIVLLLNINSNYKLKIAGIVGICLLASLSIFFEKIHNRTKWDIKWGEVESAHEKRGKYVYRRLYIIVLEVMQYVIPISAIFFVIRLQCNQNLKIIGFIGIAFIAFVLIFCAKQYIGKKKK